MSMLDKEIAGHLKKVAKLIEIKRRYDTKNGNMLITLKMSVSKDGYTVSYTAQENEVEGTHSELSFAIINWETKHSMKEFEENINAQVANKL